MDKLTTHTLPDGREIAFAPLPSHSYMWFIDGNELIIRRGFEFHQEQEEIKLPQGKWRIIGVSDQLTPIQQEEYGSLGLDTTKRYVLIEKFKS